MSTTPINALAYAEFEKASNAASDLAERIARHGRSGATSATMVDLLKAWQVARHEARSSMERVLTTGRSGFSDSKRFAKAA